MATPVKVQLCSVIPFVSKCISCSLEAKPRYYILSKDGVKGPSYGLVCTFYETSFDSKENRGSYLCKGCYRLISRIEDTRERTDKLYDSVIDKSQALQIRSSVKRVISRTPVEKKRYRTWLHTPSKSPGKVSSSQRQTAKGPKVSLFGKSYSQEDLQCDNQFLEGITEQVPTVLNEFVSVSCSTPLTDTCDSSCQTDGKIPYDQMQTASRLLYRDSRKTIIQYRSYDLKTKLSESVRYLSNGSVTSAVRYLLEHKNGNVQKQAHTAVQQVIKKECSELAKKKDTPIKTKVDDIEKFHFNQMQSEFQNNAKLLWSALTSAGTNKKGISNDIKVSTAAAVLFHSRSVCLNSFQHAMGLSLYNNQLQKEGFAILSKLGITTTHATVNNTLNKLKGHVEAKVKSWKEGLEVVTHENGTLAMDHSYAASGNVNSQAVGVEEVDHSYHQSMPERPCIHKVHRNAGYRFNLDNLDFLIRPRHMTQENQNVSKHYVQMMAVKDRVYCEDLIDNRPMGNLKDVPNRDFLPSAEDINSLRKDFIDTVALILISRMKSFKIFEGVVDKFQHLYSTEMKEKSEVIPLGILPLNENKTNDMIEILKHLHQYIPNSRSEAEVQNECFRDDSTASMTALPVGGDQLTCERIRGAHMARLDGDTAEERLEGLFCMVEDFHEKMNFLQVIIDKYYTPRSAREPGTLFQLRNLIDRRNVVSTVSKDYHAVSDFIDLVTECHVLAAALQYLNMQDCQSECSRLPRGIHLADNKTKKRFFFHLIGEIVDKFFLNAVTISVDRLDDPESQLEDNLDSDGVYNYATNITKLGLLRRVCLQATRYGDGERILRHWKYAMLVYHTAHKTKYALEGFLLQAGVNALFTPRQCHQVIHNRFVNLRGGEGHNLDGDYVMELLNKYAKSRLRFLGPNHTSDVVDRIGKSRLICHNVQELLERDIKVSPVSRKHTPQVYDRDVNVVLNQLMETKVFIYTPGRHHQSFLSEKLDILSGIDVQKLHRWIYEKKQQYAFHKLAL